MNVAEALAGQSKADFISKQNIPLKGSTRDTLLVAMISRVRDNAGDQIDGDDSRGERARRNSHHHWTELQMMNTSDFSLPPSEFLLYQTEDGQTRIEVRMEHETIWLTQRDMAELFQTTPQNITQHISAIYEEGELTESATCKDYLQVQIEGNREIQRARKHYNLDVIISVGYPVRSNRGNRVGKKMEVRKWAGEIFLPPYSYLHILTSIYLPSSSPMN